MCAARKIVKGTERQLFMQLIRRYCVPLHAVSVDAAQPGDAGLRFVGGSALLWETIEGRFFVTACHVWRKLMELVHGHHGRYNILTCDLDGPVLIRPPTLVDECDELDLAIFTAQGIRDFNPSGKEFFRTLSWPTAPARSDDMIVGCGYPGDSRIFRKGRWEFQLMFWAFLRCSISSTGRRLLLYGKTDKGLTTYFTTPRPKKFGLPGISGAPLFALREQTLDWIGIVRSGSGKPPDSCSIQATPSSFIGPDGRILRT